jgi:hypothetical protein
MSKTKSSEIKAKEDESVNGHSDDSEDYVVGMPFFHLHHVLTNFMAVGDVQRRKQLHRQHLQPKWHTNKPETSP